MTASALRRASLAVATALLVTPGLRADQSNVLLRASLSDTIPTLIVMEWRNGIRVHLQGALVPVNGTAQAPSPAVNQAWLLRTNGSVARQRSREQTPYVLAWAGTKGVALDFFFDEVPRDQLAGVVLEIDHALVVKDLR